MYLFLKFHAIVAVMRILPLFACVFFLHNRLRAQSNLDKIQEKRLPDITLTNILNFKSSTLDLSSLKGEIVILDFWSRGCGSCIASFPKVEHFNKIYKGEVFILPVTRDSYEQFQKIKLKSQILKESSLPFALSDTILHKMFPHFYVPHCVWFDKNGDFIATSNMVSEGMIDSVLATGSLNASASARRLNRKDESFKTLKKKLNTRIWEGMEYFSSIKKLSKSDLENLTRGSYSNLKDSATGRPIGFEIKSQALIDFIAISYGTTASNVILSNELVYLLPPGDPYAYSTWRINNSYSFKYIVAPEKFNEFNDHFSEFRKQDIITQFGISGEFKDIVKPCYILRKKKAGNSISIKAKSPDDLSKAEVTNNGIFLYSCDMRVLTLELYRTLNKNAEKDTPVIDETNISHRIDIYLKVPDLKDYDNLTTELSKFGLELSLEERPVKTLILKNDSKPALLGVLK